MANSRFEYVKNFEQPDILLPNTWIVVRIDGRGFTKLCARYGFEKPNDKRALDLMNAAAKAVMSDITDITIAYGVSDEFSFVFHKSCTMFERRQSKLVSTVVSTFSAYYIHLWSNYFPDTPIAPPLPTFDGRAVCYPSIQNLRDYMSWRQADCGYPISTTFSWLTTRHDCPGHINNLYNTTFWALIQLGGMEAKEAENFLAGTLAKDKNEILFSRFKINYNNEGDWSKKGSVLFRDVSTATRACDTVPLCVLLMSSRIV